MVTALTEQAERVRGLEAGADDFVSKPVDTALLFARLRALLRMKQVLDAWRLRAETARELGFDADFDPGDHFIGARLLLAGGPPGRGRRGRPPHSPPMACWWNTRRTRPRPGNGCRTPRMTSRC